MGSFNFTLPTNGQKFEIKGPPSLTLEQAKAIFDKQASTGALVGFKPGDVLSASTQAAAGLASAQAALTQAQSGITGALGAGAAAIGQATAALGATAAGAIGQVSSAFAQAGGALNGSLSNIPGINGAAGPATGILAAGVNQATNLVTSTVQTINKTITNLPVTAPINAADFVKTLPALGSIGNMGLNTVTASMASAKNLIGQRVETITNSGGVGQFGLDVSQLEKAGIVKPGIAELAKSTASTLSDVLKSPASFTGKLGINNLGDLTKNPQIQSTVQQALMATGLKDLNSLGVPIKDLSPQALAGLATVAAKSVTNAAAYLKNLPIPGDATGAIKSGIDNIMRDAAFATNLVENKLPLGLKSEVVPKAAENVTNRDTVDAAATRIVGNDKVPSLDYGPPPTATIDAVTQLLNKFKQSVPEYVSEINGLTGKVTALENQQSITQEQWSTVRQEFREIGLRSRAITDPIRDEVVTLINRLPATERRVGTAEYKAIEQGVFKAAVDIGSALLERINLLKSKISAVENA